MKKIQLNTWYPTAGDRETMQNDTSVWLIADADGMRAYGWENGVNAVKIIETNVLSLEGNYLH